mmetsp:Transcript_30818/g.65186  ORF Transcript_30818/g.65186 Transcript_30818/m.65186 type:complete len:394 (-) Transcript_30818:158-1339(-)
MFYFAYRIPQPLVAPHGPHGHDLPKGQFVYAPEDAAAPVLGRDAPPVRRTRDAVRGGGTIVQQTQLPEALPRPLRPPHRLLRPARRRLDVLHAPLLQDVKVIAHAALAEDQYAGLRHDVPLERVDDLLHLALARGVLVAERVGEDEVPLEGDGDEVHVAIALRIHGRIVVQRGLEGRRVDVLHEVSRHAGGVGHVQLDVFIGGLAFDFPPAVLPSVIVAAAAAAHGRRIGDAKVGQVDVPRHLLERIGGVVRVGMTTRPHGHGHLRLGVLLVLGVIDILVLVLSFRFVPLPIGGFATVRSAVARAVAAPAIGSVGLLSARGGGGGGWRAGGGGFGGGLGRGLGEAQGSAAAAAAACVAGIGGFGRRGGKGRWTAVVVARCLLLFELVQKLHGD